MKLRRFFTPDINTWKYVSTPELFSAPKPKKKRRLFRGSKKNYRSSIEESRLDKIINNSTEMVDFSISFTKTVVRISFILFVAVNIFILIMTSINFALTNELLFIDTLITESYGMLRDVIAAYIIKAATENSLRIGFSVLSDYLDKKYDIKTTDEFNPDDYSGDEFTEEDLIDDPEAEDDPSGEESMDGGIDLLD